MSPTLSGTTRREEVTTGTAGGVQLSDREIGRTTWKQEKHKYSKDHQGIMGMKGVTPKDTTHVNVCEK